MTIKKYGRNWAVYCNDHLICVTVYKKGAVAVVTLVEAILECLPV